LQLTDAERAFFGDANPLGFILFQRNCQDSDQVRALVADLRTCTGRSDTPILIDQEGGRVARLKPPHWPEFPSAKTYADVFSKDPEQGLEAATLGGRLVAHELDQLGITVNCAPVLDVPQADADLIVGDRAFGLDAATIAPLAAAFMDGLLAGGVAPVIKHLPGHGRAVVDSHQQLPVVDAPLEHLQAIDFAPFKILSKAPWGMTAHVVYTALDAQNPATTSALVIGQVIREYIDFQGLLISDDLSMKALSGALEDRAEACLEAGCDVALHCNGVMAEMIQVVQGMKMMSQASWARYKHGEVCRQDARQSIDITQARARFESVLQGTL